MRKLFIILLALMASPAMAADKPRYGYQDMPGAFTWTGNWIGIQGGYAGQGGLNNPFVNFDQDGWFGGLNIGTQTQYGSWVLGLELEGNYSNIKGNSAIGPVAVSHDIEAFGSLRARLGYASGPFHLYGLGGLAIASTGATIGVGPFSASDSKTHWGYVVGAGLEYAMSRNWVLGAEYAYYNFGSETYGFTIAGPIGLVTPADFDIHSYKAKAMYRW